LKVIILDRFDAVNRLKFHFNYLGNCYALVPHWSHTAYTRCATQMHIFKSISGQEQSKVLKIVFTLLWIRPQPLIPFWGFYFCFSAVCVLNYAPDQTPSPEHHMCVFGNGLFRPQFLKSCQAFVKCSGPVLAICAKCPLPCPQSVSVFIPFRLAVGFALPFMAKLVGNTRTELWVLHAHMWVYTCPGKSNLACLII